MTAQGDKPCFALAYEVMRQIQHPMLNNGFIVGRFVHIGQEKDIHIIGAKAAEDIFENLPAYTDIAGLKVLAAFFGGPKMSGKNQPVTVTLKALTECVQVMPERKNDVEVVNSPIHGLTNN